TKPPYKVRRRAKTPRKESAERMIFAMVTLMSELDSPRLVPTSGVRPSSGDVRVWAETKVTKLNNAKNKTASDKIIRPLAVLFLILFL
ncbi:MAG: hypothetical protein WC773_04710, partial [Patescibacteria group bacterium]